MKICKTININGNDCCQHTELPYDLNAPEDLKDLILYDNGDKCPHCNGIITIIPY